MAAQDRTFRLHRIVTLVLAVLLRPLPSAAGPTRAGTTRSEQATALYHQGRLAEACPLFAKEASDNPQSGQAWADLGLCEWKRKNVSRSIHASLLAFRFGDSNVRRNALFNLNLAGYRTPLPKPNPGVTGAQCSYIKPGPELQCDQNLWACTMDFDDGGRAIVTEGTQVVFGFDEQQMADWKSNAGDEQLPLDEGMNAIALDFSEEERCAYCLMHAWDCNQSPTVALELPKCIRDRLPADAGSPVADACMAKEPGAKRWCEAERDCLKHLCQRATDAYQSNPSLWPAAASEIREAATICKSCGITKTKKCEVIALDPCARRVGYVCVEEERGKRKDKQIRELTLSDR